MLARGQSEPAHFARACGAPPLPVLPRAPLAATELVWCATGGDLSRVSEILLSHPEMVDQGDEDGSTPLIAAAWTNQVEVVDFLLSKNANIDWANKTVSTERAEKLACVEVCGLAMLA